MKKKLSLICGLLAATSISLSAAPSKKAIEIAKSTIIVDGHIDVPYRVHAKWEDVTVSTHSGDFDYPRAVTGGLNAPFMSIYTPANLENSEESTALANKMIDYVEAIVGRAPDKFAIATSVADVRKHFKQGLISLPLGMENGSPIRGKIENLKHFYERGIRYITLAHSQSNHIADSSFDLRRQWKGLSPFGRTVVKEMNDLGIMVDISHISDSAFFQVIELTKAPVIASHSSLRKFTPGFERNMSDDMLKALGKNGGVIMINYGSNFVSPIANAWYNRMKAKRDKVVEKFGYDSDERRAFEKKYKAKSPFPFATLSSVLDHIDHVVKIAGIDHIGIGSDYDGVGDSLPEGLKDVSSYPNLIQGLLDRGYKQQDIVKILSGNLLRVWSEVEQIASQN